MQLTAANRHKPYDGKTRKLVIALDVGTTFGGASFAKLEPGIPPEIQGVTRFPGQQKVGGSAKVPSVIYYDAHGTVKAVGSEATDLAFLDEAEDKGYIRVEWFKLHLRPKGLSANHIRDSDIPPLPRGKSILDVFSDYLKYLYECTRKYIMDTTFNGTSYWASLKDNIDFVLTHPNGWEGQQQQSMRKAAVQAGLVRQADSYDRIRFVTEGEASLHFCIGNGTLSGIDLENEGLIIVDAGGGTIDLSAYRRDGEDEFAEIAPTQCRLQGSVFVTRRAHDYLRDGKLKASRFGQPDELNLIVKAFDATTKVTFYDKSKPCFVQFGGVRDKDLSVGIRNGLLRIEAETVAQFFEPSVTGIVEAVTLQRAAASIPIKSIVLVGGFAASEWLFSRLRRELGALGLQVFRPDAHVNKAVADGGVSFYLDHTVTMRVSRFSYGNRCATRYIPYLAEHRQREHTVLILPSGEKRLPNYYDEILPKGTTVKAATEFREMYSRQYRPAELPTSPITSAIYCYQGDGLPPKWVVDASEYPVVCTLEWDASSIINTLEPKRGANGTMYYYLQYDLVLLFGLTELKAQVAWTDPETGEEERCPAVAVYDCDDI
ncbi:hypothetical protein CYLTODRAFT_425491 [Cylindrobasidium torrendii FP15055 ss-10]|uniref:Actin-like ATPase domain-containing protein n=1 Tax=Cylindrobasidium torrendii FP15055 ss-10 TaxID=1314674 RepID=A0A0D7B3L7_9AGAR|nr:hypothetical protein CYLTODRAFT_425491 [Cylindrobasidium torrendii FP15055 ss-10]